MPAPFRRATASLSPVAHADGVARRFPAVTALFLLLIVLLLLAACATVRAEDDTGADPAPTHAIAVPALARDVARTPTATPEPPPATEVIGHSLQGRPITAHQVGSGPTTVMLVGGLHTGPEEEATHIVEQLLAHFEANQAPIPAELRLIFIPLVNPDGYALGTRLNAREVDLNRNWPTEDWQPTAVHGDQEVKAGEKPLSEPETRALYDFVIAIEPTFILSYHAYAALIEDNGIQLAWELAEAYALAAGLWHISEWPFYPVTGGFIEAMAEISIAAADVELARDDPDPFQRHLNGLQAVLHALSNSVP